MPTLLLDAPLGVQRPQSWARPRKGVDLADAHDAIRFAADYGLVPDDWQSWVIEGWLGRDKLTGRLAASSCGLSVPRQNGKNAILEVVELFKMVALGRKILHTAHEVKTARKAFLRLAGFFESARQWPELAALVSEVRRTNGQEAIVLTNGGSVEFIARSKGSGRGFTVDDLVCDEAQELGTEAYAALKPTISAAPSGDPQTILTGTPPSPSMDGEIFGRLRENALSGKASRACWDEWRIDDGADPDDPEQWGKANPALGLRLMADVIQDERASMDDETFFRERGGRWAPVGSASGVIPRDSWDMCGDETSLAVDRFSLGIEVGPDQSSAAVVLAGARADGRWHVELDEHRKGATWLVPYVSALVAANPQIRAVVGDVGGPLAAFVSKDARGRYILTGTRVVVTAPTVKELGSGCSNLLAAVVTESLAHVGQPQLTSAVAVAGKRALGDTGLWTFSRMSSASDITPIQAAALALMGAQSDNIKRPGRQRTEGAPKRRAVVL